MSVVDEVKRDLTGWKHGRVITVLDRGFTSEDNLRTLQRAGGHYIAGEKMRSGKPAVEAALSRGAAINKSGRICTSRKSWWATGKPVSAMCWCTTATGPGGTGSSASGWWGSCGLSWRS